MNRRDFIGVFVTAGLGRRSRRLRKAERFSGVGYVDYERSAVTMQGLLIGLRELGYVENQNIRLVRQQTAGPGSRANERSHFGIASQRGYPCYRRNGWRGAAKSVTSDIPVGSISVGAPIDIGLVKSFGPDPGGNMTGITFEAAEETYAKRLQLLAEIVPAFHKWLYWELLTTRTFAFAMVSVKKLAPSLGISITPIELSSADGVRRAFDQMRQAQAQALLVISGLTYVSIKETVALGWPIGCRPVTDLRRPSWQAD